MPDKHKYFLRQYETRITTLRNLSANIFHAAFSIYKAGTIAGLHLGYASFTMFRYRVRQLLTCIDQNNRYPTACTHKYRYRIERCINLYALCALVNRL